MVDLRRIRNDLIALTLMAATVFLAISLFSYDPADPPGQSVYPRNLHEQNLCGPLGAQLAHEVRSGLGVGCFVLLLCLVNIDLKMFARGGGGLGHRLFGTVLVLQGGCLGTQLISPGLGSGPDVGSGGYLGAWSYVLLSQGFTSVGIATLSFTALSAGAVILVDWRSLSSAWNVLGVPLRGASLLLAGAAHVWQLWPGRRTMDTAGSAPPTSVTQANPAFTAATAPPEKQTEVVPPAVLANAESREFRVNPPAVTGSTRAELMSRLEESSQELEDYEEFQLPGRE
ncbi:MAG: DNA translocase FtsK 4TM domain-containing protein, partial [Planctomycetaceae bacterium]